MTRVTKKRTVPKTKAAKNRKKPASYDGVERMRLLWEDHKRWLKKHGVKLPPLGSWRKKKS